MDERKKPREVKRLVLIDGTSFLYRAYHALPPLKTSSGRPTGAILGVANMVRKLLELYPTPYIAVVFDAPGGSFRNRLYRAYKGHREGMPEELRLMIEPLKALLRSLGIPLIEVPGVEADDVIATLAERAKEKGFEVIIAASDKDFMQLVGDRITVVDPKSWNRYDRERVIERFGVPPEQFPDLLALAGDPVDHIPGVRGIGPKKAAKLLQRYGSLEGILDHLDQIGERVGRALRESRKELFLWRELTTLKRDLPLERDPEDLRRRPEDRERLLKLLRELEFTSWLKRYGAEDPPDGDPTILTTPEAWGALRKVLEAGGPFALAVQATAPDPLTAQPRGLAFAVEGEAAYLPLAPSREESLRDLGALLGSPGTAKIGRNLKYDYHVLANVGIELRGIAHDTAIQSFLLDGKAEEGSRDFGELPLEEAARRACHEADLALKRHRKLWPEIAASERLRRLYEEIEMPLVPVLARMERNGILLDTSRLQRIGKELAERIGALRERIFELAGGPFNLDSPKQLQELLFDKMGLPVQKRTAKGQRSTSEKALRQLVGSHEIVKAILEYRHLAKLKSTYVDKLPRMVHPKTGRLHTTFHQTVAITGRLSSSHPNLQNIPVRTEWGQKIRRAFIAPPGHLLLSADYSQIELTVAAHFSKDRKLLEAFRKGCDIHRATAAELFGIPESGVTPEQRRLAKVINFGILYGISPSGLAEQLGISREEAARYIDRYFERHFELRAFLDRLLERARERGYAETLFGRRIPIPDLTSPRPMHRQAAERLAINAPIQGTAAEIIKKAMVEVDRWLQESGKGKLLLQVHDELLLEVPEAFSQEVAERVRALMEGAVALEVPLRVAIRLSPSWG